MTYNRLEFQTTDIPTAVSFPDSLRPVLGNVDISWSSGGKKLVVEWLDGDLITQEDPATVIRRTMGEYILDQIKT